MASARGPSREIPQNKARLRVQFTYDTTRVVTNVESKRRCAGLCRMAGQCVCGEDEGDEDEDEDEEVSRRECDSPTINHHHRRRSKH